MTMKFVEQALFLYGLIQARSFKSIQDTFVLIAI